MAAGQAAQVGSRFSRTRAVLTSAFLCHSRPLVTRRYSCAFHRLAAELFLGVARNKVVFGLLDTLSHCMPEGLVQADIPFSKELVQATW